MDEQNIIIDTSVDVAGTLQVPSSVKSLIEALVFAVEEPLTAQQIKAIYEEASDDGEKRRVEIVEIQKIIAELNDEFQNAQKPYRIIQIAGGYQFATLAEYAAWLSRLHKEQTRRKLSQSALETLAIIAYKQPITTPDIESIRGVNCDYVLRTLLEKELITIMGRAPTVGRPLLYGTTRGFLKHFGLNDIADLPRPREIEELLSDSRYETERRMLEAQADAEKAKEEQDFKSRLPHIPKKKPTLDESAQIIPKRKRKEIALRTKTEERQVENKENAEPSVETSMDTSEVETGRREVKDKRVEDAEDFTPQDQSIESPATELPVISPIVDEIKVSDLLDEDDVSGETTEIIEPPANENTIEPVENIETQDSISSAEQVIELQNDESAKIIEEENLEVSAEQDFVVDESIQTPSENEPEIQPSASQASEQAVEETAEAIDEVGEALHRPVEMVEPKSESDALAVKEPPEQPLSDRSIQDQSPTQPTSKWRTWKEKIREFFKKLFG